MIRQKWWVYKRLNGLVMKFQCHVGTECCGVRLLASGRVRPSDEDNFFYRGEGVAIVLLDWALDAWVVSGRLGAPLNLYLLH